MKIENPTRWNSDVGVRSVVATSENVPHSLKVELEHSAPAVYEINPLCDPRWAALVESHPRSSVFHSTNWLRALHVVYGYEPAVITTCPPEARLTNGLVLCRVKSWLTGWRFVSLPFSDHCEALVDGPEDLDAMLLHVRRDLVRRKWQYVEIRPISHRPSSRTGLGESLTYQFHRLDLRKSAQELFHSFHKDCVQRKIRRAEREELRYEEGNSEVLLQKFYRLLVATRRRQNLPPQPLAWFRELITAFGEDLKIRVASKGDLPVASILTLSNKKCVVYKYGGSVASLNKLGGMAFLFWKTIQEAKDKGIEELDMGRSDTDNLGLIAFKEHWGATGATLTYWRYPAPSPRVPRRAWQESIARGFAQVAPDFVLETVGTLLYKHIG
jgi:CelD/BcsL family acetyltransferase involved in cellulose biosynthesis